MLHCFEQGVAMQLGLGLPTKTLRFGDTQNPHSSSSLSCLSVLKPYSLCNSFAVIASPPISLSAMKPLDESDVGILCFISPLPGFRGVLKQRYSDFIVNEVDPDGNVVRLTSFDPPLEGPGESKAEPIAADSESYASELKSFRSLAGEADAESLEGFIKQMYSGDGGDRVPHIVLSPSSDKLHRTEIHNFFKKNLKFLVTDTVDGPDSSSKCIRVRLNSGGQGNQSKNSKKRKGRGDTPFDSRGSEDWPDNVGRFLRFNLFKENKDSQEALNVIGKMLGIQPKSFGFAGTKDKRAVTTQRVTMYKMRASRLAALNQRLIGIKVGDFCYVKEGLVLGQLSGNRFTISLRGVIAESEDSIKAAATALGRQGFVNYFGLQRFGSGSVPTFHIGAMLLKGEWKATVDLILDPREGERQEVINAREYYKETNDIDGTMRQLPRYLNAERAILHGLRKSPGNYLQALREIPRTLRMMYVHSYQSYLWNHAASMRVQKYGTEKVVVGDLVYCKEIDTEKVKGLDTSECVDEDPSDTRDLTDTYEYSGSDLPDEKSLPVKAVTEQDILNGLYTIEDVVLPMPGSKVILPENEVAQVYHDLANKDNISLTESAHGIKEFSITSMTGSYRRVFGKPANYEWELLTYTDNTVPLAETDLDLIAKSKPAKEVDENSLNGSNQVSDCTTRSKPIEGETEPENGEDRQESQTALKLTFTLPASCYATMAIRELLKTSTSTAFHRSLN